MDDVGAFDASGVPWARLKQFKAGGVLMSQVLDATYRGKLALGVFLHGGTARLQAIAGATPSGLSRFPDSVSVKSDNTLVHLSGGPTSEIPVPGANIGVTATTDLARRDSPASDPWNRAGGYDFD